MASGQNGFLTVVNQLLQANADVNRSNNVRYHLNAMWTSFIPLGSIIKFACKNTLTLRILLIKDLQTA